MDNLRAVIKNLFCYISPEDILRNHAQYNDLSEASFIKLGSGYITYYSNDELKNMYYFLENEFLWNKCKLRDSTPNEESEEEPHFNVFDALTIFNMNVLIEEDGQPKCQYAQLLRWRDMITALEEDLFITSFLAYKDGLSAKSRKNFFWKPVIGHNNRALNALLEHGVAENHFHLKGSAPHFHLSWLSMMNHVDNRTFQKILDDYDSNRLQKNLAYDARYRCAPLSHLWRQAALIRIFLFCILKGTCLKLPSYRLAFADMLELCNREEKEAVRSLYVSGKDPIDLRKMVCLEDVRRELVKNGVERLSEKTETAIKQKCAKIYVERLLPDEEGLKSASGMIQSNIQCLQEEYGGNPLDYVICEFFLRKNQPRQTNEILSGERWFLYSVFRRVYRNEEMPDPEMGSYFNWFYLYLVIKANIRRELVQANLNVGFSNFMLYQNRKEDFIDNTPYEKVYLKMAVRDTIYNQHIETLEARIAPKNSSEDMLKAIKKYDECILGDIEEEEKRIELKEKYFYVVHFVKEPEYWAKRRVSKYVDECRHYHKRKEIEKQALAIAKLREGGTSEAVRIRGIDAASPEVWCRPEVFAQAFRFLKNHTINDENQKYADAKCPQLMATYHVGEDFLDIVDGLRAIEEAILFLNLRCGDRLGHALALGVDVDDWYEGKANRIVINKLGYLDNLVWLYAKIRKYNITDCVAATSYIEKRFEEYFQEIYYNNMDQKKIEYIVEKAREHYESKKMLHSYHHTNLSFDINTYYEAWKLRGDNPIYYRNGFFKLNGNTLDEWEEYAVNKEYPINYKSRYNPEVAMLYYMYHYNPQVKYVGDQMVEIKIRPSIREAIKKVIVKIQQDISNIGIGIETNPSSNYLVGTFRRYDKHPIAKWYNLGLTNDPEELENCPQIQVSINTDDQGVFATYIENEYAYLALALEKCVDKEGNRIYNRTMIMQWLDNIRKMGISQSFHKSGSFEQESEKVIT